MAKKKKQAVSSHAKGRMRERVEHTSARRIRTEAYTAWKNGLRIEEIRGRFFLWLRDRAIKHRSVPRIYRDKIYWFAPKGRTLITVYPIPDKFMPKGNNQDTNVLDEEEMVDDAL